MERSPKELLDEAYAHLLAGQIDKAASVFQFIIDNRKVYGGSAAQIAERGINWYCAPLETILDKIEQQDLPVDIKAIVANLFNLGSRTTENEVETIVRSLTDHLKKMPDYIQVGKYFWTRREILEDLATQVEDEILTANAPVPLSSLYRSSWRDFCRENPAFPDHFSEIALEACLQAFNLKILSSSFVISESVLTGVNETLIKTINASGEPLQIKTLIPQLFPDLSSEQASLFTKYVLLNLNNQITAITPDYLITASSLQFDKISFDELFEDRHLPYSTKELLKWRFPKLETPQVSPNIETLIENQLHNNTYLIRIREGMWFSRKQLDKYRSHVVQILSAHDELVSLADLLKQLLPPNTTKKDLYAFIEIVVIGLWLDQQAIQVTESHWLHKNKIPDWLDKAYQYLLGVKNASTKEILQAIHGDIFPSPIKNFNRAFDDFLGKDSRFLRAQNNREEWHAIPVGQRDNDLIYNLLLKVVAPLTEDEIVSRLLLKNPEYNLIADTRFQPFLGSRWGLSSWTQLNDYAYEYLLRTRQALHENVVIGLVCKERGINRRQAFFLPECDSRFAIDNLNRWFCRYKLKQSDLDLLLTKLDQYAGAGRKLEILFQETLRIHPDSTNAQSVLCNDHRFIQLDDLWYSRRKAYRNLSSTDIETIYDYFSKLPTSSPAIPLKNVGINSIGWDGRLTDAATLLSVDDRFIENHPGFWSLSSWSTPDYSRSSQGGVAVVEPSPRTGVDDLPIELPDKLTKRKRHRGEESAPKDAPPKFYHTLSHLDILHGNIRINGLLRKLVARDAKTIAITDNEGNEVVAYIDETQTILNLRDWILLRELTYGDKISIQAGQEQDSLYMRPYGKRDDRVFQEAMQHQDIEKLIAEARRVNKTYHDLIIEIMDSFGMAMHREDIFQLVDYQRTATRNTIFEILSLPECPYDELRYFVPKGKGFWLFDRQKKRAYDMKMKELLDENSSLKGQVVLLSTRLDNISASTDQLAKLSLKIETLEKSIRTLSEEKVSLSKRINELKAEKSQSDLLSDDLSRQLVQAQNQLSSLEEKYQITSGELDSLRLERRLYQEREAQLQEAQSELVCMRAERVNLEEKLGQLPILEAELSKKNMQYAELNGALSERDERLNTLQVELGNKTTQLSIMQKDLELAASHISSLQSELEQSQIAFSTLQVEASQRANALDHEISDLKAEIGLVESRLLDTETAYKASLIKVNELRDSGIRLLDELNEARSRLSQFEGELAKSKEDIIQLQKDYEAKHETELSETAQPLQAKIASLEFAYNQQAQQLVVLTTRLKRIEDALATPLGRLFALIQGLN